VAAAAAAAPLPIERAATWTPPPRPPVAAAPVPAPTLGVAAAAAARPLPPLPPSLIAQHLSSPPAALSRAGISAEERTRRFTARALALAAGDGAALLSPPIPAAGDAQRSPAWHAARSGRLTASAFGNALGFWDGGRAGLWEEKVGLGTPFAGNAATAYGTAAEAPALAAYAAATGLPVTDCAFGVLKPDPAHDWLGASPDGLVPPAAGGGPALAASPPTPHPPAPGMAAALAAAAAAGGPGILEIKCPFNRGSPAAGRPWAGNSAGGARTGGGGSYYNKDRPPPFYYMPQVQGLMAIFGRAWCHLWCWTPVHGASLYTIEADPAYWAGAYEVLADLWWRHITPARLAAADAAARVGCADPARLLVPGGLLLPGGALSPSAAQLAARAAVEGFRPADLHPLTAELEAASKAMAGRAAADAVWFENAGGP